jgi:hypothetical protein
MNMAYKDIEKKRAYDKAYSKRQYAKNRDTILTSQKTPKGRARLRKAGKRYQRTSNGQRKRFEWNIFDRYGMSRIAWDRVVREQAGRCAICNVELRKCCIDHNHQTGQIRGLLCLHCNSGIGFFKDNPNLAVQGAEYLKIGV